MRILIITVGIILFLFSELYSQCDIERYPNYILGMDIHYKNKELNFVAAYSKGFRFVYIKKSFGDEDTYGCKTYRTETVIPCTTGDCYNNDTGLVNILFHRDYYRKQWDNACNSGFVRGMYHFWLNNKSAEDQAKEFLVGVDTAEYRNNDSILPPALDLEDYRKGDYQYLDNEILKWIEIVERALMKKVIIYIGTEKGCEWQYYSKILKKETIENLKNNHPLWGVRYPGNKLEINAPDLLKWNNWSIWQFCNNYQDIEIGDTNLDVDYFYGNDLIAFIQGMKK